ncbi:HIT family protein [Butyrivibrio sp. MC2013]|uniref:HIT family protein n=1 Tax=Butyrivibrio sp. MC2013 TaxID=1280686 RepID=UPI00040E4827|nr:HIT family protein [Butyrivibrio sp. MC2013]
MKDANCIFCKLAGGDIPTNAIYEDDDFKVILDNGPATAGHALILPKDHSRNLLDLPDETAAKVLPLAKKLAQRMKDVLGCDGLNLVQNNGSVAGQTVMHFHLHVIPRYESDDQRILWKPTEPDDEQLRNLCARLKF